MYSFKRFQELGWAAFVAAGVFALTLLVDLDPDAITDWRAWAIAAGAGCLRAAVGAVLAILTKPTP
jgi:hypothetical protein